MGDYTRERQNGTMWRGMQMEMEHVWNSFYLHALVGHALRSERRLTLPNNDIHHSERYAAALEMRNEEYSSAGRPFWNHICDGCSKVVDRDGAPGSHLHYPPDLSRFVFLTWSLVLIRAAVVDGVTIGHPCCAIHDCKEALPTKNSRGGKPRYCTTHANLEFKCATTTCNSEAEDGFKTCNKRQCRHFEESYKASGSGMFQLKERLARARDRLTGKDTLAPFRGAVAEALTLLNGREDVMAVLEDDEAVEVEDEVVEKCYGKNGTSKRQLKARFGRKRTHNDELCVYTCGIIAGRTAMFGSEAPNGVRVSHYSSIVQYLC